MWNREFKASRYYGYDLLMVMLIVLIIVGFTAGREAIITVIGLYAAYITATFLYDRNVTKTIALENPRQTIRLFPGESDDISFRIENRSIFPAINGRLTFETENTIMSEDYCSEKKKHWNEYDIPVSFPGKSQSVITLPVNAQKRGAARIRNLTYRFPHIFNFENITLRYGLFFNTEVIVYPRPLPVKGVESLFEMTPGSQPIDFSPFEDVLSTIGTRDYQYSDPFHRINWKASAKTQTLQTNVYEKVIDRSYVFIVNIAMRHGTMNLAQTDEKMDRILSYTAYLCQFATEKGYPYELYINARKPGHPPYMVLPEGQGKAHLAKALEMLARIPPQTMIIPFHRMLHQIGRGFTKQQSVIVIGDILPEAADVLNDFRHTQENISHAQEGDDEGAIMTSWKGGMAHVAK